MTCVRFQFMVNCQAFADLFTLLTKLDQILEFRRGEKPLSLKQNLFPPSKSLFWGRDGRRYVPVR